MVVRSSTYDEYEYKRDVGDGVINKRIKNSNIKNIIYLL